MKIGGPALALNTAYQTHRTNLNNSMARLASGDKYAVLGEEPAADLSLSQRFRHKIKSAEASTSALQTAQNFLNTTEEFSQTVGNILTRMMEIAAAASDGQLLDSDRTVMDAEFQSLKQEITEMSRTATFFGKQTIGRDVMGSYDANSETFRFWQATGDDPGEISRDFGADATDAQNNLIGFSATEDFTFSQDGRSLYYMGTVSGDPGGTVRVKKYDLDSNTVTYGAQTFATGDTLFVDEDGQLYANGSGTLYTVDSSSLSRTTTLVTDLRTGQEFSVYNGNAYYSRSADEAIAETVVSTGASTALTGALTFGAGDHAIASSGRYVAEEDVAGRIRVIDTQTGNESNIVIGAGTAVNDLQFNTDGDRIYYINEDTAALHYIDVGTDLSDNVVLTQGEKVVQGVNANSFNGLDLGGANPNSRIQYVLHQDTASVLSYEAVDLRVVNLGIAKTQVDTYANANAAIDQIRTAQNRLAAERAKTGAMASRFQFAMDSHLSYISNMTERENAIRNIDVAKESIVMTNEQVQQQAAAAILTQFNTLQRNVLQLLTG